MDRIEKIGLGSALGGHALLLAAFSFGLFSAAEQFKRPAPIAVSLVGEIAPISTAPDAIQEEPAPASAAQVDSAEPPPAPEAMKMEQPVPKPNPAPIVKQTTPKPTPKVADKPKPAPKVAAATRPPAKSGKGTTPTKSGGFSRSFEDAISTAGKNSGQGKAVGTPAEKSASEVRRSVNASLAGQIRPYLVACAPSGVDIDEIRTFITLSLEINGSVNSVRFDRQTGINDSNSPQADLLKQCAMKAARQASPYRGLDSDYYDVWKNHAMQLKAN